MTTIKGILFDKDGTLLDFNGSWLAPYLQVADLIAEHVGNPALAKSLMRDGGYIEQNQSWMNDSLLASGSNKQIFDFWSDSIGKPIEGKLLEKIKQIFNHAGASYVTALPDLGGFLRQLKSREIKLGLATMDDFNNAEKVVRKLQLQDVFDFICGADSGFGVKPEAGMVRAFCQQCELEPDEVMMVGDSPKDINMGRNANVALTVGVLTGAHDRLSLEKIADLVFNDISEISSIL